MGAGLQEFRQGWRVVAGAALGLTFSVATLLLYPFGAFIAPLEAEFGWSRLQLSSAITLLQLSTAVSAPLYGHLIDRLSPRLLVLTSTVALGALVASLGLMQANLWQLGLTFALIPLLSGGATPISYARMVVAQFELRRGVALGLALAGVGIGAAVLPAFAQYLIQHGGWRNAYLGLGLVTVAVTLPLAALLPAGARSSMASPPVARANGAGTTKVRIWSLVLLAALFAVVGAVTVGVVAHLAPILRERGLDTASAASAASLVGISVIGGRLAIGLALDRFHGGRVLAAVLIGFAVGLLLLLKVESDLVPPVSAVLIGFAVGAEVDVIAYLVSRYFPAVMFGRLYGVVFAVFVLGSAVGPLLLGWSYDRSDGYGAGLTAMTVALLAASATAALLPKYPTAFETCADAPDGVSA